MAKIDLKRVNVEFPVYNVNARSLKKQFLRMATGGAIVEDATRHVMVCALKDINLSLRDGDRVGLVGHNGAGKSTLLRLLANIYEPTTGQIKIEGHISPLLNIMRGIETEFTGIENIITRGTILGLTRQEINEKITEISDFTGLGDYLSLPLRTYSSGMLIRLAFAISTSVKPEVLLIDEVFGAGDADFMERAKKRMANLLQQSSIVVMASHADALIKEFCNKVIVMESGHIKYFGDVDIAMEQYYRKAN